MFTKKGYVLNLNISSPIGSQSVCMLNESGKESRCKEIENIYYNLRVRTIPRASLY